MQNEVSEEEDLQNFLDFRLQIFDIYVQWKNMDEDAYGDERSSLDWNAVDSNSDENTGRRQELEFRRCDDMHGSGCNAIFKLMYHE